ncbi:MAG: nucleotidyltransferase family protein [Syntrophomonadaceae bacterium]|nr:nucleotidyltransferase family protein [Syntrophomonadaceae bacterium]
MKAIILAGGLGTRLYPLLRDLPKPMAPVGNRYFLEIVLDVMRNNGLTDFTFCVCHMADKSINHFGDGSRYGVKISYSIEEAPAGTGGAIRLLRNDIHSTFCVLNGDTYQELDLQQCIARHKLSDAIATMSVVKVRDSSRYGQVITDREGYVTGFREKGAEAQESLINTGLYILEPAVFNYIPEDKFVSFEQDVLIAMLKCNQKIGTYDYVKNFRDIGIPTDYHKFLHWVNESQEGSKLLWQEKQTV